MSKLADKLSTKINNRYYISIRDWNALNHQSKEVLECTYNKARKKKTNMSSYEEQCNLFLKRYFIWLSAIARKWLRDIGPHFQYFPFYNKGIYRRSINWTELIVFFKTTVNNYTMVIH